MRHEARNLRGGFTIVEAVMVTVIVATIGAIALPRYAGFRAQRQVDSTARRIMADLTLAQRKARQTSAGKAVVFDVANNAYRVYLDTAASVPMPDPNHPSLPYVVHLNREPYAARIVSATFGGDPQVNYDGYGTPDSSGSVVIEVGAYRQSVDVTTETGLAKKKIVLIVE